MCRRKRSTGHHTDTQMRGCSRAAGQQEWRSWAGNGVNPLLETVSCPWAKQLYLSSDQSSLCACVHRSTHVSRPKNCANLSREGYPQRAYPSALVAYAIDQDGAATCGILQQILLPADLINSLQTERLIPHQTPTYPFLPPRLPPTVSSHPLPSLVVLS